ncbi:NAD-dependent epimerase/dehydratase family protein [Salininema proteolyticum]|uniref:NAD-dependent epimerase/dehydratase family protein n=1 Tax=Salininema proteolyticum TaxID=1607685 RepID=A0ABV8U5B4_9ACTN
MPDLHVILGATGAVGRALVAELSSRGHRVRAVSRNAEGPEAVRADISTPEGARAACAGASVVYQCAQPPLREWASRFPELTRSVLAGAEAAGAKLVMADNLYVYGPVGGPMTEGLPHRADFPKGRARAEVDRLILDAHRSGRVRAALGRASDYYGPHGIGTVLGPNLFAAAAAGKTVRWVGALDQPRTLSYLPDIAAGLATLGERDEADGRAWHLPAAEPLTGREFLDLVEARVDGPMKTAALTRGVQRLLGLFNPTVRGLSETWYQFDRPFIADDSEFRDAFGPVSVTPHADAVAATVDWFSARGGADDR